MGALQELKTQIENTNALGIQNLAEQGVELPENSTTYDIMTAITQISGGGIQYTSITYTDDTIILIDTDGVEHIIEYEYTDETLTSIKYDGKVINLTYDGDLLVKIGKTTVDFENVESNGSGGTEELETLIDESGVLDSTEGSVTEKVEELIDKAKSGGSASIDENGIVTFGGNTTIDDNGIVTL